MKRFSANLSICLCLCVALNAASAFAQSDTDQPEIRITSLVDEPALLEEGRRILLDGDPATAMSAYFDKIITRHESITAGTTAAYYGAHSTNEIFLNRALARSEGMIASDVGPVVPDAYLAKAYSLIQLRRLSEARAALQNAMALSPFFSPYISELAFTYAVEGDWDKSIAAYRDAAKIADEWATPETKTLELSRAWRGEGDVLASLGRLDEADALYRQCLDMDPKDLQAAEGQKSIEKLRKKNS